MYELQEMLKAVTGMQGVSLTPMAGAQGELTGVAMIQAYHKARGDLERNEILVPDAAHGTNPATATMLGCVAKEIPTGPDGDIEMDALKAAFSEKTAGIMLTNPSTLGVFERDIVKVNDIVSDAGGLLYYDGANLNAILGKVRPGDMGFDVIHMNLHKTFSTPHGGGGPGSGAVGVGERLLPYMPVPIVGKQEVGGETRLRLADRESDLPQTIGRLSGFMGNAGVLLRAYVYMRLVGRDGMQRIAEYATLNANYLQARLGDAGFEIAYPGRRASHEFIITLKARGERVANDGDGHRQGIARLQLPRAHDLLPVAGSRVPADRADGNRKQGDAGQFRERDDRYREACPRRQGIFQRSAISTRLCDASTTSRRLASWISASSPRPSSSSRAKGVSVNYWPTGKAWGQ